MLSLDVRNLSQRLDALEIREELHQRRQCAQESYTREQIELLRDGILNKTNKNHAGSDPNSNEFQELKLAVQRLQKKEEFRGDLKKRQNTINNKVNKLADENGQLMKIIRDDLQDFDRKVQEQLD